MTEATFRKDLQRGMQAQGVYVYKIPDLAKALIKPFDLLLAYDGLFRPMELKLRKLERATPLHNEDMVISQKAFRPHQLPTLVEIHEKNWGYPLIGACLTRTQEGRAKEKMAWLIRVDLFIEQQEWTVGQLDRVGSPLLWKPRIGWTVEWLDEVKE